VFHKITPKLIGLSGLMTGPSGSLEFFPTPGGGRLATAGLNPGFALSGTPQGAPMIALRPNSANAAISVVGNNGTSTFGLVVASSGGYAGISMVGSGSAFNSTDFELYQQGSTAVIYNGAAGVMEIFNDGVLVMQISATRNVTIETPASGSTLTLDTLDDGNSLICNDTGTVTDGITAINLQHGGAGRGYLGSGPATMVGAAVNDFGLVAVTGELSAVTASLTSAGNLPVTFWQLGTTTRTLTSQTAAQQIFAQTTHGAVTLPVGTYEFEVFVPVSGLSATSGSFGFALGGTATFNQDWWSLANKLGANGTPETAQMLFGTAAVTTLATASTATSGMFWIRGTIRVSVAGTVIPQISLTVAAAGTVGVGAYCFFRYMSISGGGRGDFGPWS
jgi:hypothetical protein